MSTTVVNNSLSSLPELIARLQSAKFAIATSEVLDATRLLVKLAENNASLPADFLRNHLRPLLCKSTERQVQQQFDVIFQQWWDEGRRVELESIPEPVTPSEESKPPQRKLKIAVRCLLLLALVLLNGHRLPQAELTEANPSSTEQITDVPNPVQPYPGNDKPQNPVKPESPRIYGYWPAYRYTETLRPALAWLLVGAPLLLLLFFHLPAWALSRRRSGGGAGVMLKGWDRDLAARRLVKPLSEAVASRFDWHIRGPAEEIRRWSRRPSIDVARTVSATLAGLGIPRLRYRHARLHPEYLVLVEAEHDDDFAMLWAERLKKQGLAVDLRRLSVPKDGSRPYWHTQQTGETGRLDNLPNPGFAQRLIVVSDGGFLLDGQGQWQDWAIAAQLQRWPVRALFSPKEPRDLLTGRLAILDSAMRPGDPGFLVLPQEESALAAWSTWLSIGQMPVIVPAEAQRFPRLIAGKNEQHYLNETAPDDNERARLIAELHVYLGENGFYWLCCCAIPPLLRTGLTLLLGEEYLRRAGASDEDKLRYHLTRNYRLLIRLPWLRHNQMPDWLRLALLLRLSPPLQEEMRDVVDGLLARQSPDAKGSLPLGFDAPQASASVGAGGESQSTHHALYLGFMSGLSARQLQLRIPGPWQSWLNRLDSRPHSLRRWRDWRAAGFARLLFRGGLPENGAARFSLLAGWVMTAFSVAVLTAVAVLPPKDWPQSWREVLFVEGAEPMVFKHERPLRGIAYSADGHLLITVGADDKLQDWNIQTGAIKPRYTIVPTDFFISSTSPDGKLEFASSNGKDIWVKVIAEHSEILKRLANERKAKEDELKSMELKIKNKESEKNGKNTSPGDNLARLTAELITIASEQNFNSFIGVLLRHEYKVDFATFSPDGKQVATVTEDGTVHLWDAQVGMAVGEPMRHNASDENPINSATYSPDGSRAITVGVDGTVKQWDARTGTPVSKPLQHENTVPQASQSSDGQRIVTVHDDGTAWLSDAKTKDWLGVLPAATGVSSVAFHPEGNRVLIAGGSEARIWRISPYPAPKPAFEFVQNHLKIVAIFLVLLALLLERTWYVFSQYRLKQRLHYYAPGISNKTAGRPRSLGVVVRLRSAYEKFVKRMRLHKRTPGKFSAPE